jgi:hypothetical protein
MGADESLERCAGHRERTLWWIREGATLLFSLCLASLLKWSGICLFNWFLWWYGVCNWLCLLSYVKFDAMYGFGGPFSCRRRLPFWHVVSEVKYWRKVLPIYTLLQMMSVLQTPGVLLLCFLSFKALKLSPICGGFEWCALNGVHPIFLVYLGENLYYSLNVNNAHLVDSTPYHSCNKSVSTHLSHFQC